LPVAHSVHIDAPVVPENLPAVQLLHTELCVAPALAENLPASQLTQTACPVCKLYVPALQDVQALAPAAENVPAAQSSHTELCVAPALAENLPRVRVYGTAGVPAFPYFKKRIFKTFFYF
jgi:hypothetical protein